VGFDIAEDRGTGTGGAVAIGVAMTSKSGGRSGPGVADRGLGSSRGRWCSVTAWVGISRTVIAGSGAVLDFIAGLGCVSLATDMAARLLQDLALTSITANALA
jgi:hypothetical protein